MTISRLLEDIDGEYLGNKNSLTIWVPDKAGKIPVAQVNFDPKTRKWAIHYNGNAPQSAVEAFKTGIPQEHIKAMIKMAASGEYSGNDGKYDFIFSGGELKANNPD